MLTKLDGTAKGGAVLAISDQLSIPVRFIGIGETQEQVESAVDRFDQDFSVMTVQLQKFINALYSVFGVIKL